MRDERKSRKRPIAHTDVSGFEGWATGVADGETRLTTQPGNPDTQEYGSTDSKHHFVGSIGHQAEPSTGGLVYMRARWYDPAIGRFISEDPAKDGVNWYAYCGGNPIGSIDPSGRSAIPNGEADTIIAEFGAAIRLAGQILTYRGFGHIQQGNIDAEAGKLLVYVSEAFPALFGAAAMSGGYMLQAIGGRERIQGFHQVGIGLAFSILGGRLMSLDLDQAKDYQDEIQEVLTQ